MCLEPVIGLSGQLGSGKSSLASILAQRNSCPRAAFGDYLRDVATGRGLESDRASLQQLGEEQIALGWDAFCSAVLNHFGWKTGRGLVVDGIRHVDALKTLSRMICPQSVFLVHLTINEELRHNRLLSRDGVQAVFDNHEKHSTEADVKEALPLAANMIVDAARPAELLADEIMDAVLPKLISTRASPLFPFSHELAPSASAMYSSELN